VFYFLITFYQQSEAFGGREGVCHARFEADGLMVSCLQRYEVKIRSSRSLFPCLCSVELFSSIFARSYDLNVEELPMSFGGVISLRGMFSAKLPVWGGSTAEEDVQQSLLLLVLSII
jgi:hypothetical protein